MKLLRLRVISAETCGGLLDDLDCRLRSPLTMTAGFDPVCFVGPNGAGKSQFLQVLAEVFQSIFHVAAPTEERIDGNPDLQFDMEYLIQPKGAEQMLHVRTSKIKEGSRRPHLKVQVKTDGEWRDLGPSTPECLAVLPQKIVGYTSGGNETLSLPFLISRSGYADEVGKEALNDVVSTKGIPDTRLMLIDYGTHLEVLVANLLLGGQEQADFLLNHAQLRGLHSFRCVVQLAHSAAPPAPGKKAKSSNRKGVQLTDELEKYIDNLKRCATCSSYDEKTESYIFDYWVSDETKKAFAFFWESTLDLYASFHKIAMLNDLIIPKTTRERFRRDTRTRRFASRLPEPQDEHKVFRFERVAFSSSKSDGVVDYVALSDGEHQLAQLLGTFCMVSFPNVLFLLDEPESHFNPKWRVKAISLLRDVVTENGPRRTGTIGSQQDCLLTTHSPFVPSDMLRENVFIFSKDVRGKVSVKNPDVQTYGATFDTILEQCFDVRPPISDEPRNEIAELMRSEDSDKIRAGMNRLGDSVERAFLADRLRSLAAKERG